MSTMGKGWPWQKPKHDPEASSSVTPKKKNTNKTKKPCIRVSVAVEFAHQNPRT
jgi:hypothetical protein